MMKNRFAKRLSSPKGKKAIIGILVALVVLGALAVFAVANIPKDVTILDGETSLTVTTNENDPQRIIEENGFELGENDVLDSSQFAKQNAVLIIKREISIHFCEAGEALRSVTLPARTAEDVLRYLGKTLEDGDAVEPAAFEIIKTGDTVIFYKAGTGTLVADGESRTVQTSNKTVKELLAENNITLGKDDTVKPALKTVLADGGKIVVTRVSFVEKTEKESIAFETKTKIDDSLAEGTKKVVSEGKDGVAEVTYRIRYEDGKAVKKEAITQKEITAAENRVVAVGTRGAAKEDEALDFSYTRKYEGIASAYYEPPGSMTASGMAVGVGRIGVNPKEIPYGTKLYVTGYGYCVAADCGWGTTGMGRIADLYMTSEAECEAWGVRNVTMYVLE